MFAGLINPRDVCNIGDMFKARFCNIRTLPTSLSFIHCQVKLNFMHFCWVLTLTTCVDIARSRYSFTPRLISRPCKCQWVSSFLCYASYDLGYLSLSDSVVMHQSKTVFLEQLGCFPKYVLKFDKGKWFSAIFLFLHLNIFSCWIFDARLWKRDWNYTWLKLVGKVCDFFREMIKYDQI